MKIDPYNKEEKLLKKLINLRGKRVLEIGCGSGRISFWLAPSALEYLGIDLDKKVILEANRNVPVNLRGRLKFRVGLGSKTGLPDKSIEAVLMVLCLHEIALQDQGRTLSEAWRVLKRGSELLIAEPTDPPGTIQTLYDFVYRHFFHFDHPVTVRHANWVLERFMKSGEFNLKKKVTYQIDWHFEDFKELTDFLLGEFRGQIRWTTKNKVVLKNRLEELLGNRKHKEIIVIDKLNLHILKKEDKCQ